MIPYYADDWLTIYQGDVRVVLPELASDSVDCIVTSPPYWGLRDYGTANWDGGDADCDHKQNNWHRGSENFRGTPDMPSSHAGRTPYRHVCGKCGAVRQDSQIGLERTPEEYVANLVAVFRELRRVLKPSGTCWLNLGDSYAGSQQTGRNDAGRPEKGRGWAEYDIQRTRVEKRDGLKPKDLVGIPWRVAFALQADGWYLRSDVIWAKPNPMPESVTDRPTKAHEYLFLLTKSARYYYDADAVREAISPLTVEIHGRYKDSGSSAGVKYERDSEFFKNGKGRDLSGRNLRSVWTIATRPYPGAHFAVFPPELPERCIKAGSSERGVCPECGKPWERVVEREGPTAAEIRPKDYRTNRDKMVKSGGVASTTIGQSNWHDDRTPHTTRETVGWRPPSRAKAGTYEAEAYGNPHSERRGPKQNFGNGRSGSTTWSGCAHDAEPEPAVVLDPFAGSGTTGMVANRLSRRAILIDLNGDYLKQQLKRNAQTPLGLGA